MKSPLLLFALKCSVILYFAACSGIDTYSTSVSATPFVTKGFWKVNLFTDGNKDQTNTLSRYVLVFEPAGKIKAIKNGIVVTGNWSEDDISKKITINLDTDDPVLTKLNKYWAISAATKTGVSLQNFENPAYGRLQITSL